MTGPCSGTGHYLLLKGLLQTHLLINQPMGIWDIYGTIVNYPSFGLPESSHLDPSPTVRHGRSQQHGQIPMNAAVTIPQ